MATYPFKSRVALVVGACALALLNSGCRHDEARNLTADVKTVKVELVWNEKDRDWKVKLNGGNAKKPKDAETTINPGDAPRMFVVSVVGGGPNPPTFRQSGGLAVWVGSKDTPQPGINSSEIVGPFITTKGKMVFFDLNAGSAVKLNYALYFNEAGVPPVDPIIDNGGGHDF